MAMPLQRIVISKGIKTKYFMIPRIAVNLLEYDIGVMVDWIERTGYGADMNNLKRIQDKLNIVPRSLENWLRSKLQNENKIANSWKSQRKRSKWNLKLDKQ